MNQEAQKEKRHPIEDYLRSDMLPHIWCPGCGLGIVLKAYVNALEKAEVPMDKRVVVSGIGCSGRAAGYLNQDSYHTTHGRPIAFATGLKLGNPDLNVTVISGDGDLFAIGGNHFIHAARRNIDLNVICVNNFNYGMTGGQAGPTTPVDSKTSTTPYGNFEHPFNLPHLAASSGAVYVARWTTLDARRLRDSIAAALKKRGFTFIEVISPCPTGYGRPNRIGEGIEEMRMYQESWDLREDNWIIQEGANPRDAEIELRKNILVGVFAEVERPTFQDLYWQMEPVKEKRLKHMLRDERKVRE
ncbi:MAG: 2-oxoacid:ferredoxin oxidoreductase subunit beta [Methanomassiliicoccales archaeon]|nr:MAG: 2-oxoacid:ferredoxin oxidoreductase subunit beta [Methanomassiliicoccales archaeon]